MLLAGLYFANIKDKKNLHTAQCEFLENVDSEIYEQLKLAYHPSYNQTRKTELFEIVFSHINAEIIDAFKEKESTYLEAKTIKTNNLEKEKIGQRKTGLVKLTEIDETLKGISRAV